MNLYDLHSNPEELHGYSTKEYRVPDLAYKLAIRKPELRTKLESSFMKNPALAYYYTRDVLLKRRWPEAEPYIMKDPMYATHYAINVLKRRWPEAEPYIMKDPYYAYMYAKFVLKRRWPDAEPYIKTDNINWSMYRNTFDL